jgi:2-keto-4-pentenoate hydratase
VSAATAEFLAGLRLEGGEAAALPEGLAPRTLDEGYGIQQALVERLVARRGGKPIGYKIACSNELAQRLLNVDAPVFGTLMSASTHRSPATLRASDFRVRCMEPEFGFELAKDVPPGNYDEQSIRPFVASAFPCLELVDHHFVDWTRLGAPTLVADNAIHGAWIAGEPCTRWQDIDFARQAVALRVNGKSVCTGSGAAVLGHPLRALAWLATELPRRGRQLRAGERVSTGIATDIYLASAGDHLEGDFGAVGTVSLRLE